MYQFDTEYTNIHKSISNSYKSCYLDIAMVWIVSLDISLILRTFCEGRPVSGRVREYGLIQGDQDFVAQAKGGEDVFRRSPRVPGRKPEGSALPLARLASVHGRPSGQPPKTPF